MEHCDKGPALDRIEQKVDSLADLMVAVAEQKIDSKYTHKRLDDHEGRLKGLEGLTVKKLLIVYTAWIGVIGSVFVWMVRA